MIDLETHATIAAMNDDNNITKRLAALEQHMATMEQLLIEIRQMVAPEPNIHLSVRMYTHNNAFYPIHVIDAVFTAWEHIYIASIPGLSFKREVITLGSVRYFVSINKRCIGFFDIRSLTATRTGVTVYAVLDDAFESNKAELGKLNQTISTWHDEFIDEMARAETKLIKQAPQNKPGPKRTKINQWALDQRGKIPFEEIVAEYARRRRKQPTDARELLRKMFAREDDRNKSSE